MLAAVGSTVGIGLAWLGIRKLHLIAPTNLPRLDIIAIDARVLTFTLFATTAATALVSVAPIWHVSRSRLADALRAAVRAPGLSGGGRVRSGVVIAAVALSFVLLIGSGLMYRSFRALQRIDTQFEPHGLLTFRLVGNAGAQPEQRAAYMQEIKERLLALPGVQQVTASAPFPLAGGFNATRWGREEAIADPRLLQSADFQTVLPGYFETLRTPLLEGRTFTDADNAPGRNLVVIDRQLATKGFPHESALGKRLVVHRTVVATSGRATRQATDLWIHDGSRDVFSVDNSCLSG